MTRLEPPQMAERLAQDIPDGSYVNLGIGMPVMVANYVPEGREVIYHSENGILGVGPTPEPGTEDPDLINAAKQYVTLIKGGCYFDTADSFAMMRGGHLDIAVLGGFQVSADGNLANWATDNEKYPPAVGGAMDLSVGAKTVKGPPSATASVKPAASTAASKVVKTPAASATSMRLPRLFLRRPLRLMI